jgi:hypothetical protein
MPLPDALRRPGIRWDNIKPVPFDVRLAVRDEERNRRGLAEVWQLLPHPTRRPDPGEPRNPYAGKDD